MKNYENFIAYRRKEASEEAQKIYKALVERGYTTFMDTNEPDGGNYKENIPEIAESCTNYIVILTPTSFDRCRDNPNDMFGKGIAYALENNKRVIPVFTTNFKNFPTDLPDAISRISDQNGCFYTDTGFDLFMDGLVERFLLDNRRVIVSDPERDFYIENDTLVEFVGRATIVNIPDRVKRIGNYAFKDHTKITKITMPEGLLEIGDDAFERCIELQNIIIPDTVLSIGKNAFSRCYKLVYLRLGKSLEYVGELAFSYCCKLKWIEIPGKVDKLAGSAFNGCSNLKSIFVEESNKSYKSKDGILYNFEETSIIRCPENYESDCIEMPSSITKICAYAFYRCTDVQQINLPHCTSEICDYAFEGCANISKLVLHGNVSKVADTAFAGWEKSQISFSKDFSGRERVEIEKRLDANTASGNKEWERICQRI